MTAKTRSSELYLVVAIIKQTMDSTETLRVFWHGLLVSAHDVVQEENGGWQNVAMNDRGLMSATKKTWILSPPYDKVDAISQVPAFPTVHASVKG